MTIYHISCFLIYYKQIFKRWKENQSSVPNLSSTIASQVIQHNELIKVDSKGIYNFEMSQKDINYVDQLFKFNGKRRPCEKIKSQFNLQG